MKPHKDLQLFLKPYPTNIQELALAMREFITSQIPEANELIWDNYNAVAIAYSKSKVLKDAFCHLSVYANHVNFGFNRGSELSPNNVNLLGQGALIRHIKVTQFSSFPQEEIKTMLWEAMGIAQRLNPELREKTSLGVSNVMSVSEKK